MSKPTDIRDNIGIPAKLAESAYWRMMTPRAPEGMDSALHRIGRKA